MALTDRQKAELDALLMILCGTEEGAPDEYDRTRDEIVSWIQEQIDKGPADAARYRWLRANNRRSGGLCYVEVVSASHRNHSHCALQAEALDMAIDDAMTVYPSED